MNSGWQIKRLDELYEIARGGSPRPIKNYMTTEPNGINWIKISDATASIKYIYETKEKIKPEGVKMSRLVHEGDFILSNSMSFGRPYIMKTTGCIHDGWLVFHAKTNQIDNDYMYYLLGSDVVYQQFDRLAAGSTVRNLNSDLVRGVTIPVPPLPEQQHIVAVLDEAFAGIATATDNAKKNLQNARELFESHLQSIFTTKGDGWVEKTLGDIAEVEYGYTDKSTGEGDYRYVRITDIDTNGELILEDKKYIKHSKEAEGFLLADNDLLMARTGATFAKVLFYKDHEPSVFASYLIRIKFKENIENKLYWYFTKTVNYWAQANSLSSGAAQPHFNGAAVKQVAFRYPKSVKEQQLLIEKLDALAIETKRLEAIYQQKLDNLAALKQSILQKAFAGELHTDKLAA